MSPWSLILAGLGLAMLLEGLPYFISPSAARKYLRQLIELQDGTLRFLGLALMLGGLLLAWLAVR